MPWITNCRNVLTSTICKSDQFHAPTIRSLIFITTYPHSPHMQLLRGIFKGYQNTNYSWLQLRRTDVFHFCKPKLCLLARHAVFDYPWRELHSSAGCLDRINKLHIILMNYIMNSTWTYSFHYRVLPWLQINEDLNQSNIWTSVKMSPMGVNVHGTPKCGCGRTLSWLYTFVVVFSNMNFFSGVK